MGHVIIMSLVGIAVAVILYSVCALEVRKIIALIKGDEFEFKRLDTPYEEAEYMAVTKYYKSHGVTREIFAKYWEREKRNNPNALPYDAYISIMEELTITKTSKYESNCL